MVLGIKFDLGIVNLMQQAWDATKLTLVIRQRNSEKALVLHKKHQLAKTAPRRKEAIKEVARLFKEGKYEAFARLFIPHIVLDKTLDLVDFWWKIWDLYWIFVVLRIVMVFLPSNSGYVHPDEYFQSVEVIVGDVMEVESHRTWEFNVTQPLRSPSLPMFVYGSPLYLLKFLNYLLHFYTGINVITPYLLHLIPKVILLLLSFSIDFTVYQICKLYKHDYNKCLTTLSSSYIMLVYSTRTFSNTLEMLLSTSLLYLVAHCMKRSDETLYLQEMVEATYRKTENIRERVQIHKKRKLIPAHDFKYFIPISIISAVGFFNRPTFLFFAFSPLFFWFQRGISTVSIFSPFQMFNFRMLSILPLFLLTCLILLLTDSLYFGQLTLHNLWHLKMDYGDWKLAPLNFIMFNIVPGNVATHGSHPRWTHILVNLPILLGPLAPIFLVTFLNWTLDLCYLPWSKKPGLRTVYALTMFMAVIPILALSAVPHQEARFLLPILPAVILMTAHKLRYKVFGYKPLLSLWYIFNILATVWFGFIHQAGVVPVTRQISYLNHGNSYVNLVYSHTYMPPRYPLLQPKHQDNPHPYGYNNMTKYTIHELGSAEMKEVHSRLLVLASRAQYMGKKHHKKMSTFLVLPTHLHHHLDRFVQDSLYLEPLYSHAPHISVESMDKFDPVYWDSEGNVNPISMVLGAANSLGKLSLSLYNVTIGDEVKTVEMNHSKSK